MESSRWFEISDKIRIFKKKNPSSIEPSIKDDDGLNQRKEPCQLNS